MYVVHKNHNIPTDLPTCDNIRFSTYFIENNFVSPLNSILMTDTKRQAFHWQLGISLKSTLKTKKQPRVKNPFSKHRDPHHKLDLFPVLIMHINYEIMIATFFLGSVTHHVSQVLGLYLWKCVKPAVWGTLFSSLTPSWTLHQLHNLLKASLTLA